MGYTYIRKQLYKNGGPMFIIKYNGIFEYGSVRFWLFCKPKNHNPTKFKFKWIAQFWCNIANSVDTDFKTYYVSELLKEQENQI
jgi:hypothetical protein